MPPRSRWSLQVQLPLALALLLLALATALTLSAHYQVRTQASELAAARLNHVADRLATSVGFSAPVALRGLSSLAADTLIVRELTDDPRADSLLARRRLATLIGGDSANTVVTLWDVEGRRVLSTELPAGFGPWLAPPEPVDSSAFTTIRQVHDSLLYYDLVSPVRQGRVVIGYLQRRSRVVGSEATSTTVSAMLGDSGALLFGSRNGVWTDLRHPVERPDATAIGAAEPVRYDRDGAARLGVGRPVPGTPWLLVAELPVSAVNAPSRAFLWQMGGIALGLTLVTAIAAWWMGRGITRPLDSLRESAEAIRAGIHGRRADPHGHPELAKVARTFNAMADRTDRHIEALQRNDERLRSLVAASAQIVWFTDADGNVQDQAPSWQQFTGQTAAAVRGVGWLEAVHPDDRERIRQAWADAIAAGAPFDAEYRVRRADGEHRILHSRGVPVLDDDGAVREWVRVSTDITPTRRVEERLQRREEELAQARRLDAIGRLAGGIAHDFNNILTAILVPAELALESLPADAQVRADLEEIRTAGLRATELTGQLLAFSRQQVLQVSVVDFDVIVEEAIRILGRLIPESITMEARLDGQGRRVRVDRSQIEQVIINLAINARDAMPDGGELLIETAVREVTEDDADRHDGLSPGPYVMLAVTDSGMGMTAETRERIFEPFFTTKPRGQGSGLGLATVYGIVRQSEGDIWLYSEEGEGTVVKVYFPVATAEAEVTAPTVQTEAVPQGEGTVLLAEDDAAIRRIGERMLRRLGYEVLVASNGEEALQLARRFAGPIHLLVSDVVMPGMSGVELYEKLGQERPGIPVLFLSGWTGEAVTRHRILEGDVPFLQKPFTSAQLGRKVHEVLHGEGASE